jgi:predicted Zn-dependent peptidase
MDLEASRLVFTLDGGTSAWTDLLGRIETLRKRGFKAEDLVRARTAWSEGRALAALDPESLMDEAQRTFRHRHPGAAELEALSLEALNRALRRWLDPANLRLGATGEPASLKELARP